jgi:hypothetical protein
MSGLKTLRRLRLLAVLASFVLAACGGERVGIAGLELACAAFVDLEPSGDIVVPVGGSERVRVQIQRVGSREFRDPPDCSYLLTARPNWTIDDPDLVRVEEYSATAALYSSWTITGLAAGETRIHLRYDVREPEISIRLKVVES